MSLEKCKYICTQKHTYAYTLYAYTHIYGQVILDKDMKGWFFPTSIARLIEWLYVKERKLKEWTTATKNVDSCLVSYTKITLKYFTDRNVKPKTLKLETF